MIIPGALIRRRVAGGGGPGPGPDPEVNVLQASTIVISREYGGPKDVAVVPFTLLTAVRNNPAASITPKANVSALEIMALKEQDRASSMPKHSASQVGLTAVRNYDPYTQSFTIARARVIIIS